MNHKALFLAVTLIALLVIGGAIWLMQEHQVATNQPVVTESVVETLTKSEKLNTNEVAEKYAETWNGDTGQWKLYRNEEAGIEIKYPEEIFTFWENKTNSLSVESAPDEYQWHLTQKGYSDYKHKIWVSLNSIRSEKEYYSEREEDTAFVEVPIGKKTAKIFTTKKGTSIAESKYKDFLDKGICDPETFTVVFDERDNGEFRSYAHVGCEGEAMGKIYQAVYHSISFLDK